MGGLELSWQLRVLLTNICGKVLLQYAVVELPSAHLSLFICRSESQE